MKAGDVMGLVDRIERKLESTVGDAFARVFGGSIVPQEVEVALRRKPRPAHAPWQVAKFWHRTTT